MELPSQVFFGLTRRKSVYNIQSICNIPSIIENGILSYNRSQEIAHKSVALETVQSRRGNKSIPQGRPLHDYASAYFDPRNPMMYRLQQETENLCVLAISSEVLNIEGTIISDGNAASQITRFYSPEEGIDKLDYVVIYGEWWTSQDENEQLNKKRIKCAEILVPDAIPYSYVVGACVVNEKAQMALSAQGFEKVIKVTPKVFFGREAEK